MSPPPKLSCAWALLLLRQVAAHGPTSTTVLRPRSYGPWMVARRWTLRVPPVLPLAFPVRPQRSENQSSGRGWERGGRAALGPYFLLSSLARQVAASTALMVAARSPPCSRA